MNRSRRLLLSALCLLALLANGAGALAQRQTQDKVPPPEGEVRMRTNVIIPSGPPDGDMRFNIMSEGPGDMLGLRVIESGMNFESTPVKGAPYSAEAVNESTQTLADGNRIVRKSTSLVYRDGEGRTRREQSLSSVGPFATAGDAPTMIFINDPVAGVNYVLDPRAHIARKGAVFAYSFSRGGDKPMGPPPAGEGPDVMFNAPAPPPPAGPLRNDAIKRVQPVYPDVAKAAGAQGNVSVQIVIDEKGEVSSARAVSGHPLLQQAAVDAARQWVFKPLIIDGRATKVKGMLSFNFTLDKPEGAPPPPAAESNRPKPVKESLGTQTIEGVNAEGTRLTLTLPAGMVGNEQPINIVTETWYAPELHVMVMSKHSDPRFGETTYRLTNINRSEPARSLFEVPADYTVKEAGPERREFRMKRIENEQ